MRNNLLLLLLPALLGYSYVCVDINFTPYAGAENLISLHKGIEKVDSYLYPSPNITLEDIKNPSECPYLTQKQIWLRKAKSILFWIPVNSSTVVTQHEVFGHGYRIRDLGSEYAKVTGYQMFVIGGSTQLSITDQLTTSQEITIDIAGVEADAILANKTKLKWLNNGRIDGSQSTLYPLASLSLFGYTLTVKENPTSVPKDGNDIKNYLFYLNSTYQEGYLTYTKTRNLSLLNFLDPFIYYSILSQWIYDSYRISPGIPMFKLGPVGYLPSVKLMLAPFGLQGYFENFFVVGSSPTYLYLKWGQNGPNQYWGLGAESPKVLRWHSGSLGFRLDVWNQPNVLFEQGALSVQEIYDLPAGTPIPPLYPTDVLNATSFGAAFSVMGTQSLGKWPITLYAELGYKTAGYLPGEALRESPIARGGFSGQF